MSSESKTQGKLPIFTQNQLNNIGKPAEPEQENASTSRKQLLGALLLGTAIGAGYFLLTRYKISSANQYLVRTGLGIKDILISKNGIQWPFQRVAYVDLTPKSYNLVVHAMSNEKMEFILPTVFTIGPKDDLENLRIFAKFLLNQDEDSITDIIKGVIEGETRVLAANMSIEEIFKGRTEFKSNIVHMVQEELGKLGCRIYNANIKELQDSKDSRYFSSLAQKISAEAENQARIDISEAKKKGVIGEKEREGITRQSVSEIEAKTNVYENERQEEVARSVAQLESKRAEYDQKIKIARIESEKNSQKRQEEMQREVEAKRLERETEASRAENLSKARVQSEVKEALALGDANAMRQMADASFYKRQREIEAVFYEKEREAEAKRINLEAEALGIGKVLQALGNDHKTLVQYLMLEKNLYPQLADASAKAIQGLNPKITVWSTGGDSTSNAYSNIQGLAKSIPPLIETIEDQTNLRLPDWLMKRKSDVVDKEVAAKLAALQEKKVE